MQLEATPCFPAAHGRAPKARRNPPRRAAVLGVGKHLFFPVRSILEGQVENLAKRGGNANIRQLAAERRMQELATQTGGAVYSPIDEDEMNEAFKQISAELSQQYILSYYPDDPAEKRGEFRSISVAVKGKQNVSIRTRKGYYVPKK